MRSQGGRANARAAAARVLLSWAVLLAFLLNVPLLGARAGVDAGRLQAAAQMQALADAGVLCTHDAAQGGEQGGKGESGHPCCNDCLACQWAADLTGPLPRPEPAAAMPRIRALVLAVPRTEVIGAAAFKRGPPPRAPPHLMEAAQAA
ncbi:DUF2946 family protein [Xanthobacter autotrophicus DSM 431]|uniref:DUF2946 family protein n=1 Tax=Xanthobacter nonsaccharivorans TaxID=3119912 RepID=UPI00372A1DCA